MLPIILFTIAVIVVLAVLATAMTLSNRPDGKMLFLESLIDRASDECKTS